MAHSPPAARDRPPGPRRRNRAAFAAAIGQHGMVPDLLWDDVKSFFDPLRMGDLPDLWVSGASVEDWQAVFDLVRSSGWKWEYREGDLVCALPSAAEVLSRADEEMVHLYVWPVPGARVIFRPWSDSEIDFDVDLYELQGQAGVDILCGFLSAIGRRLGKPVSMTHEGGDGTRPVLGFDVAADRVVLLADPVL